MEAVLQLELEQPYEHLFKVQTDLLEDLRTLAKQGLSSEASSLRTLLPVTNVLEASCFSFLNLPNEIILQILGDLKDEDLYMLAFLSRRMHHLSLPLYLSRRGFGNRLHDQLVLFDYNAHDILRALNAALFRPSLRRLYYALDFRKNLKDLQREIKAVRHVITKLSALQEATISLQTTTCEKSLHNTFIPNGEATVTALQEIFSFGITDAKVNGELTGLLESVISCGCKSLMIDYHASHTIMAGHVKASIAENFSGLRGLSKIMDRYVPPSFRTAFVNNSRLDTFYLHSPMAFSSDHSRWTIKTLNNLNITTLFISFQCCISEDSWALILPCIDIPNLTKLSIDFCFIRISDLFSFLNRHTNIQELYLGHKISSINLPVRAFPTLRKLTHLSAPANLLVLLLSRPRSISGVTHVTIIVRIPHGQTFRFENFDASLAPIASVLESLTEIHLSLSFGSTPFANWMYSHPYNLHIPGTGIHTSITHLQLLIKVYSLPLSVQTKLPEWLANFTGLRSVNILTLSERESTQPKECFLRALKTSCPGLESIGFGVA